MGNGTSSIYITTDKFSDDNIGDMISTYGFDYAKIMPYKDMNSPCFGEDLRPHGAGCGKIVRIACRGNGGRQPCLE